ncbi:hypothetical protein IFM89_004680 [Coptis chinensis]|uniref:Glycosyltransferase family 28 N-terminal domain-containing protein n=1 Tax=Coptis chinensis TaxID=261450 RepID=A0A835GXD9_9MAGN|nr:hypothetical protein IFM89_004680 [Coptis chinensis]
MFLAAMASSGKRKSCSRQQCRVQVKENPVLGSNVGLRSKKILFLVAMFGSSQRKSCSWQQCLVQVKEKPILGSSVEFRSKEILFLATMSSLGQRKSCSWQQCRVQKHPSLRINITPSRHLKIFCCLSPPPPLDQTDKNSSIPTNQTNSLRIIFAAGGTGGHIYHIVAIADELKNIDPSTQILFLGTQDGTKRTGIPASGYDFDTIQAFPLIRPLYSPQNLLFPFYLIKSVIYSWEKLRDFEPHVVNLDLGGYVYAPVCLSGKFLKGVKMVIQEQNSKPGDCELGSFFFC